MLEELEHAKARGAKIYAEVTGYGCTGDAYHITSPAEDGSGAAKAMELAMEEAQITPAQVDYINAHGTSTITMTCSRHAPLRKHLARQRKTCDQLYEIHDRSLAWSSRRSRIYTCVKSMEDGFIHQTVGTKEADEECDLNYAIGSPVEKEIKTAMSNSLGFGGHNATILIQKYEA